MIVEHVQSHQAMGLAAQVVPDTGSSDLWIPVGRHRKFPPCLSEDQVRACQIVP